ncbi:hypothetical protein [Roseateles toxinivorans]|uniref:Uncharacterized protein n=1 Tax=Roseateles toxinivorans TaxID=270368 RepID=A0A4R6QQ11_9BURK|nr:hypothetical protein [Roseateles toxinivorans]TDP73106.1 hypothetical protein DES47_102852 [Roseateles toxinivorans]
MRPKYDDARRRPKADERTRRNSATKVRYLSAVHDNCYLNTEAFIKQGRQCAMYEGIDFDSAEWNVTGSKQARSHKQRDSYLNFTAHKTDQDVGSKVGVEFSNESQFAETVKAFIRLRAEIGGQSPNNQSEMVIAFRYLYDALKNDQFDLKLLTREHLDIAARVVAAREKPISRYKRIQKLEEIARVLDSNRLTMAQLDWRCSWNSKPADHEGTLAESKDSDRPHPKLPKDGVIEAVAHLYKTIPSEAWADRVRICLVALLPILGFRIGELLTLPALRLQTEDDTGRKYLIYYPEKGAPPQKKWLMTAGGILVEQMIDEILGLTAGPRGVAAWLYDHPGSINLEFPSNDGETVALADIQRVLGIGSPSGTRQFVTGEGRGLKVKRARVAKSDLVAVLRSETYSEPVSVVEGTGEELLLKDALACAFKHAFHAKKLTLSYAVLPISEQQISDFICGRAGMSAVFARYGIEGPNGSTLKVSSHAFRHWLNDCYDRGGLSDVEQAVYFGRRNPKDNRAYQHKSPQERVREAREALKKGTMKGPLAEKIRSLPVGRQDAILAARVQAVHVVPGGACFHQFSQSPCPNHMACKSGCGDFHWQTDDQIQTKELEFEKGILEAAIEAAKLELGEDTYGADVWLQHNLEKLAQVDRCIADSAPVGN